jgi:hypothetical protein
MRFQNGYNSIVSLVGLVNTARGDLTRNALKAFLTAAKEYIERRHGEPFKFLFLPKMGLLGSQAVLEKKVQF